MTAVSRPNECEKCTKLLLILTITIGIIIKDNNYQPNTKAALKHTQKGQMRVTRGHKM